MTQEDLVSSAFGLLFPPVCNALLVQCVVEWSRFFQFRLQVDMVDIFDRITERKREFRELEEEIHAMNIQALEIESEALQQEIRLRLDVLRQKKELEHQRHENALAHFRNLKEKIRNTNWKIDRQKKVLSKTPISSPNVDRNKNPRKE